MNFKKIGTKMLLIIIPVILLAQVVLTVISALSSSDLIDEQVQDTMVASLDYNEEQIAGYLDEVKTLATAISMSVVNTYTKITLPEYEKMLAELIQTNDMVLGSGLWFEPYAYDKDQEYVGPYVYKDGGNIVTTYDYSNAEYDYFNQEYYTFAKSTDGAIVTDPYYDETSGTIMSTCSAPILLDGKYIGCVTVDVELTAIKDLVASVSVGKEGSAMLTTSDGTFLGGVEDEKIGAAAKITEDENESLKKAGADIIANESGTLKYTKDGESYNMYYSTVDDVNWKFIIQIPTYELKKPVYNMINKLIIVCIIAVVFAVIVIIIQIGGIAKSIQRVQLFAKELAEGNFTVSELKVRGRDELANMSTSLNEMYGSNKHVIGNISKHAVEIKESSARLSVSAAELKSQFENIAEYMSNVNEDMMNTSAATQELTASVEQVNQATEVLSGETRVSLDMAQEIRERAGAIEKTSQTSFDKASALKDDYERRLAESIEQSKVVENIGQLARIISDIAEQITLLSLNASIEAARAGEQGRGFAVVASEIGKLAGDTADAVENIQKTIQEVQGAFEGLAKNANVLLEFVSETVTPDYQSFVEVAVQYGKDAESINSSSEEISRMAADIQGIMNEVTSAIQNIAVSTQNTADSSASIMTSVDDVSDVVVEVNDMSEKQQEIADDLNDVVNKFKISVGAE